MTTKIRQMSKICKLVLALLIFDIAGCASIFGSYYPDIFPSTNDVSGSDSTLTNASQFLKKRANSRHDGNTLVLVAISGGGSRAAYFATAVLLKLQSVYSDVDILEEIDAISSVSGGSIAAANYAISEQRATDASEELQKWDEDEAKRQVKQDFEVRGLLRSLLPWYLISSLLTNWNRSDTMADSLDSDLFSGKTFADIGPDKPILIVNATDDTQDYAGRRHFGERFTFTNEEFALPKSDDKGKDDFDVIGSDVSSYSIARAVMASAAFPGAFHSMNLRDYRNPGRFVHLYDGGVSENLGLASLERAVNVSSVSQTYDRIVIISIDAYPSAVGKSKRDPETRKTLDYFVDVSDVEDAFAAALRHRRDEIVEQFMEHRLALNYKPQVLFWHISLDSPIVADVIQDVSWRPDPFCPVKSFEDLFESQGLRDALASMDTTLYICDRDVRRIDQAVEMLVQPCDPCLLQVRSVLFGSPSTV
jgi:NTE family protein